jgi:hypothetical protein
MRRTKPSLSCVTREPVDRFAGQRAWRAILDLQLCVEGDGTIDPAALSMAVASASRVCPGERLMRRGHR